MPRLGRQMSRVKQYTRSSFSERNHNDDKIEGGGGRNEEQRREVNSVARSTIALEINRLVAARSLNEKNRKEESRPINKWRNRKKGEEWRRPYFLDVERWTTKRWKRESGERNFSKAAIPNGFATRLIPSADRCEKERNRE